MFVKFMVFMPMPMPVPVILFGWFIFSHMEALNSLRSITLKGIDKPSSYNSRSRSSVKLKDSAATSTDLVISSSRWEKVSIVFPTLAQ